MAGSFIEKLDYPAIPESRVEAKSTQEDVSPVEDRLRVRSRTKADDQSEGHGDSSASDSEYQHALEVQCSHIPTPDTTKVAEVGCFRPREQPPPQVLLRRNPRREPVRRTAQRHCLLRPCTPRETTEDGQNKWARGHTRDP